MKTLASMLATAGALFATATSAQAQGPGIGQCPVTGEFCLTVAVPESSASSGSGNIYMRIQALATYSWVAVGTGTSMSGSNIFVLYQDGAGNVTVSPRSGQGRTMPQAQTDTRIQLLAGSGVEGGIMTAHVLCANCESWDGGEMDLAGDSSWIAAWNRGDPLNTASVSARIVKHQGVDQFSMDLAQGRIAQDANPFLAAATGGTGGNAGNGGAGGDGTGDQGGAGGGLADVDSDGASGGNGGGSDVVNLLLIHGIVMSLAFIFLYPVGAALIPLGAKWYLHVGCQVMGFIAMWVGFATGVIGAQEFGALFKQGHTIIGAIVVIAMVFQPVFGLLHHRHFRKHGSRSVISHVHIWYGRLLVVLGIINGGLGLRLSGAPSTFVVAYAVVAAVVGVAYGASALVGGMRRARDDGVREKVSPYSPNLSPGGNGGGYGYQRNGGPNNQNYQFQARPGYGAAR